MECFMPLRKIELPVFELELPSTGQKVKYHQFTCADQKILLTGFASQEINDMENAVRAVIQNCLVTENINVDKLPSFDLEYIFLQLRIKSVGNETVIRFLPKPDTDCPVCSKQREVELDLSQVKVVKDPSHTNLIHLDENMTFKMKYPNIQVMSLIEDARLTGDVTQTNKIIASCVDIISDGEDVLEPGKDIPLVELEAYIDDLSSENYDKINDFFKKLPVLEHKIVFPKCPSCGSEDISILRGLADFLV